jgi:two-component system phosphate regulon sensor histidine kinase PhoR
MSSSNKKSYKFTFVTAFLVSFSTTLVLSVFLCFNDICDFKINLIFGLITFVIGFLIIQNRIEKYIFKRVEKIYKDIMILESKTSLVQNTPVTTDMDFLSNEINKYAKIKTQEVQSFQGQRRISKRVCGQCGS